MVRGEFVCDTYEAAEIQCLDLARADAIKREGSLTGDGETIMDKPGHYVRWVRTEHDKDDEGKFTNRTLTMYFGRSKAAWFTGTVYAGRFRPVRSYFISTIRVMGDDREGHSADDATLIESSSSSSSSSDSESEQTPVKAICNRGTANLRPSSVASHRRRRGNKAQ